MNTSYVTGWLTLESSQIRLMEIFSVKTFGDVHSLEGITLPVNFKLHDSTSGFILKVLAFHTKLPETTMLTSNYFKAAKRSYF